MAEPSLNTNKLFFLLRKLAKTNTLSSNETTELANEIYDMAAINTIERFGSQLDAFIESNKAQLAAIQESTNVRLDALKESTNARLDALKESNEAQLDAFRGSNRVTRWIMGVGLTLIGLGVTAIGVMVAYGMFFAG